MTCLKSMIPFRVFWIARCKLSWTVPVHFVRLTTMMTWVNDHWSDVLLLCIASVVGSSGLMPSMYLYPVPCNDDSWIVSRLTTHRTLWLSEVCDSSCVISTTHLKWFVARPRWCLGPLSKGGSIIYVSLFCNACFFHLFNNVHLLILLYLIL